MLLCPEWRCVCVCLCVSVCLCVCVCASVCPLRTAAQPEIQTVIRCACASRCLKGIGVANEGPGYASRRVFDPGCTFFILRIY